MQVMGVLTQCIRVLSALLEPFMPTLAVKINYFMGFEKRTPRDDTFLEFINSDPQNMLSCVPFGQKINQPFPLITQISNDDVASLR